jgi:hypothetical protein
MLDSHCDARCNKRHLLAAHAIASCDMSGSRDNRTHRLCSLLKRCSLLKLCSLLKRCVLTHGGGKNGIPFEIFMVGVWGVFSVAGTFLRFLDFQKSSSFAIPVFRTTSG